MRGSAAEADMGREGRDRENSMPPSRLIERRVGSVGFTFALGAETYEGLSGFLDHWYVALCVRLPSAAQQEQYKAHFVRQYIIRCVAISQVH